MDAVLTEYDKRVQQGILREDPRQRDAVLQLNDLGNRLLIWQPQKPSPSFLEYFSKPSADPATLKGPKGLYMYGGVGTGKTMLMDLFLDAISARKTGNRVHFNQFMHDVHMKRAKWRSDPANKEGGDTDSIDTIVTDITSQSKLLCFDEFQVTNIADAMLLGRLFSALWQKGTVVVATSNRVPDQLYKGGLQRDLFVPWIAKLKEHCHVHCLDSHKDYRLTGKKIDKIYIVGSQDEQRVALDAIWNKLTENRVGTPFELVVMKRKIEVPSQCKGIARFHFDQLCSVPLGAADYNAIASKYHTILLENIPTFHERNLNEARRFITFVDQAYEHKTKLICSAEDLPNNLFKFQVKKIEGGDSTDIGEEEAFAFNRTASRLSEMQTALYLEQPHIKKTSALPD